MQNLVVASIFAVAYSLIHVAPPKELTLVDKPILINETRMRLIREYRQSHFGIDSASVSIIPQMIIIHCTAMSSFSSTFAAFYRPELADRPELRRGKRGVELNTSTPFLVDKKGTVYRLQPADMMTRHAIGLNNVAIGIENVGCVQGADDLTPEQLKANVALIKQLLTDFKTIAYLIGHYEYEAFRGTPLWLEKDATYFTEKVDPGPRFMVALRKQLRAEGITMPATLLSR